MSQPGAKRLRQGWVASRGEQRPKSLQRGSRVREEETPGWEGHAQDRPEVQQSQPVGSACSLRQDSFSPCVFTGHSGARQFWVWMWNLAPLSFHGTQSQQADKGRQTQELGSILQFRARQGAQSEKHVFYPKELGVKWARAGLTQKTTLCDPLFHRSAVFSLS